jgi:signal transduction histidine kinase
LTRNDTFEDILKKEIADHPKEKIRTENCAVTVLADEMLGMVLHNIISTSIKFRGAGVEITVSTRDNDDGTVEISVIDNGRSIPDYMKPFIFDRFMKDSDKRSSYGPGLHIVKLIVEAYGEGYRRMTGYRVTWNRAALSALP